MRYARTKMYIRYDEVAKGIFLFNDVVGAGNEVLLLLAVVVIVMV